MPRYYSCDLRNKALEMFNQGYFKEDVCEALGIAITSLNRWIKLKRTTGTVE